MSFWKKSQTTVEYLLLIATALGFFVIFFMGVRTTDPERTDETCMCVNEQHICIPGTFTPGQILPGGGEFQTRLLKALEKVLPGVQRATFILADTRDDCKNAAAAGCPPCPIPPLPPGIIPTGDEIPDVIPPFGVIPTGPIPPGGIIPPGTLIPPGTGLPPGGIGPSDPGGVGGSSSPPIGDLYPCFGPEYTVQYRTCPCGDGICASPEGCYSGCGDCACAGGDFCDINADTCCTPQFTSCTSWTPDPCQSNQTQRRRCTDTLCGAGAIFPEQPCANPCTPDFDSGCGGWSPAPCAPGTQQVQFCDDPTGCSTAQEERRRDCPSTCGNGQCDPGDGCYSCPGDCPPCDIAGGELCDPTSNSCCQTDYTSDCDPWPPQNCPPGSVVDHACRDASGCGGPDKVTPRSCPVTCPDGTCDSASGEGCSTCPQDCPSCTGGAQCVTDQTNPNYNTCCTPQYSPTGDSTGCTEWSPAVCRANQQVTRECDDLNGCTTERQTQSIDCPSPCQEQWTCFYNPDPCSPGTQQSVACIDETGCGQGVQRDTRDCPSACPDQTCDSFAGEDCASCTADCGCPSGEVCQDNGDGTSSCCTPRVCGTFDCWDMPSGDGCGGILDCGGDCQQSHNSGLTGNWFCDFASNTCACTPFECVGSNCGTFFPDNGCGGPPVDCRCNCGPCTGGTETPPPLTVPGQPPPFS